MIAFDLPMPDNCMYCPIRMECGVYTEWLKNRLGLKAPKPLRDERCLMVKIEVREDEGD